MPWLHGRESRDIYGLINIFFARYDKEYITASMVSGLYSISSIRRPNVFANKANLVRLPSRFVPRRTVFGKRGVWTTP